MLIFMIIVIGIIVLCMGAVESNKKQTKLSAIREKDRQMTNANLEQSLVDKYMKHGYSFDEAFEAGREELILMGYSPCIPKAAYKHVDFRGQYFSGAQGEIILEPMRSSYIEGVGYDKLSEKYDSFEVKSRKGAERQQWRNTHGENIPEDELDKRVFSNFPQNEFEYQKDCERMSKIYQTLPVGSYIIYPKLGTCEIVGYNYPESSWGTYQLKVLNTGQVVNYVRIGDSRIQRQR